MWLYKQVKSQFNSGVKKGNGLGILSRTIDDIVEGYTKRKKDYKTVQPQNEK